MNREIAGLCICRLVSCQLTPVFNRWVSSFRNARRDRRIWPRCIDSFLPWHCSIPQNCLIPRWYSSIFQPNPLKVSLSVSDASRISVAQNSKSSSDFPVLNTLMNPYPRKWTILPSVGISTSEIGRLPVSSGLTSRLDFSRVNQCQGIDRTKFRFSILAYQLSNTMHFGLNSRCFAVFSMSLKWSFLVLPSVSLL